MNMFHTLFKRKWFVRLLITLSIFSLLAMGGYLYGKYQLNKWEKRNKIKIKASRINFSLLSWQVPALKINNLKIIFKDNGTSIKEINAKQLIIGFNILSPLKKCFADFELPYKGEELKVTFDHKNYIESKISSGRLIKKDRSYQGRNIVFEDIKLYLPNLCAREENKTPPPLLISQVEGAVDYNTNSHRLKGNMSIPSSPFLKTTSNTHPHYSLNAQGEVTLLPKETTNPPLEGEIKVKIRNISNLLSDLHQLNFISLLEANLGSVVGYFSSRKVVPPSKNGRTLKKRSHFRSKVFSW